jgi:hypothetical protein
MKCSYWLKKSYLLFRACRFDSDFANQTLPGGWIIDFTINFDGDVAHFSDVENKIDLRKQS